jgi:transcriptional regulator with XRE-family HTH domain
VAQVKLIRSMKPLTRKKREELARRYGVSRGTIENAAYKQDAYAAEIFDRPVQTTFPFLNYPTLVRRGVVYESQPPEVTTVENDPD